MDLPPPEFLRGCGRIRRVYDRETQDSGNITFDVETAEGRLLIKTAGAPDDEAFLDHRQRVDLLENAAAMCRATEPDLPGRFASVRELLKAFSGKPDQPDLRSGWDAGESAV